MLLQGGYGMMDPSMMGMGYGMGGMGGMGAMGKAMGKLNCLFPAAVNDLTIFLGFRNSSS